MDFNKKIFWFLYAFLFLVVVTTNITSASKTMYIEIIPSTVVSGDMFTVSVLDPDIKNETPYLTDVAIVFNDMIYLITSENDTGEITIQAPNVLTNTTYVLTAYKEGYLDTNVSLNVTAMEPSPSFELFITAETDNIRAYQTFGIIVTDADAVPIESALVYIQGNDPNESDIRSDKNGHTYLTAPNLEKITIIAKKQGYTQAEKTLVVRTQLGVIETLTNHPNFPIAIAVVILITVVIYVAKKNRLHSEGHVLFSKKMRKKHTSPTTRIPDTDSSDEYSEIGNSIASPTKRKKDLKIEEIHIPSTRITKDIITLQTPTKKPLPSSTYSHRWFEGPSAIDEKIDNLHNLTSEKSTEKWFVGTEDLRKKIDETIKEKDTKLIKKHQTKQ
jgi:hypothetical protein